MSAALGLFARIRAAIDIVYREMAKFGAVGAIGFVTDVYVFNLLRTGIWPLYQAPLADKALTAGVISTVVAMIVNWIGNRYWTFRHRRRSEMVREFITFMVMSVGGLLIAMACLGISHYVLGFTSPLADNIAKNVVGLALGTVFRFWSYRTFVFTEMRGPQAGVTLAPQPALPPTEADLAKAPPARRPGRRVGRVSPQLREP